MLSSITRLELTIVLTCFAFGMTTLCSVPAAAQTQETTPPETADTDPPASEEAESDDESGFWNWLQRNTEPAAGDTPRLKRNRSDRDRGGGHGG